MPAPKPPRSGSATCPYSPPGGCWPDHAPPRPPRTAPALRALVSRGLRRRPEVGCAEVVLRVLRVPGGDLDVEVLEAELLVHLLRDSEDHVDLARDLVVAHDVVRVVLSEGAYAEQAVQPAGLFVAGVRCVLGGAGVQAQGGVRLGVVGREGGGEGRDKQLETAIEGAKALTPRVRPRWLPIDR